MVEYSIKHYVGYGDDGVSSEIRLPGFKPRTCHLLNDFEQAIKLSLTSFSSPENINNNSNNLCDHMTSEITSISRASWLVFGGVLLGTFKSKLLQYAVHFSCQNI